jgi:myo-inositol-1(or 4)-monophosphatase
MPAAAFLTLPFDVAQVVEVVEEASRIALDWQGRCAAQVKSDNTLVTEADRAIEAFLRERLALLAPGWSFLGEESGLSSGEAAQEAGGGEDASPCWAIDPIDGTTNFVRGVPLWCVSVGLVHRGRPILGVVSVPPLDEMLWGVRGGGAFYRKGDGAAVPLQARDPEVLIQEDLIACNTSVEEAVDFSRVPCRLRNLGTLAYHFTLLARGVVCASLAHWHKLYDIAAGMCLCEEVGCAGVYLDGREWNAHVSMGRETVPLLVAAPHTRRVLLENLQSREVPLQRAAQSLPSHTLPDGSSGE